MSYRIATARVLAGALFALLLIAPAAAQMPPDIAAQVKALGPVIDPPKTAAIYAPLAPKEPYDGVKVTRDVKYGPDARNLLDVFTPETATGPLPVFVFVHGGGYVGGNKRTGDSPFYDNFALFAAKNGMVGVNATYRIAPKNPYPAAPEDIAAATKWITANIASHGGDPSRVFIVGHSAGAAIVAQFLAAAKDAGVKGALLISGTYDFTSFPAAPIIKQYLGDDMSKYKAASTVVALMNSRLPIFLAWSEFDPPAILKQSEILNANLCIKGRCPDRLFLKGHSHMSEAYSVNTDDRQLTDAMLAFMRKNN